MFFKKAKKKENEGWPRCPRRGAGYRRVPRSDALCWLACSAERNGEHRPRGIRMRRDIPHRVRSVRTERVVCANVLCSGRLKKRDVAPSASRKLVPEIKRKEKSPSPKEKARKRKEKKQKTCV